MASKENKLVNKEILQMKQDSVARVLRIFALAVKSGSVSRQDNSLAISRPLRRLP